MATVRQPQRATRNRNRSSSIDVEIVLDVDLNSTPADHSEPSNKPIDLDAIEDEVLMCTSSRRAPRCSRLSRSRRDETIIILDEGIDTSSRPPGFENDDENHIATSSQNINHKRGRSVTRTVIDCEIYPDEDYDNAKRKKTTKSMPEPPKEPPAFSCPVCMNALVEASSTICGHVFCHGCIVKSIQAQKKCPTCRRKLKMNNFHRVYLPSCA